MFEKKVVVITGGAQGIGAALCRAFAERGAHVCAIDVLPNPYFVGDVGREEDLRRFAEKVLAEYGHVDILINNAKPAFRGINACSYQEFEQALRVGVTAPFFLTQLFLPHFAPGACVVNISSTRDRMSQPQSESYTAAKGGISALTHALAVSLAGRVRVNAVSPGWIETQGTVYTGADAAQHPAGRVGVPEDIVHAVLFLCSPQAGFITGENLCVDGGMTHQMIYHDDHGWRYSPEE